MTFVEKLKNAQQKNNSWACVGLDVDLKKMPPHLLASYQDQSLAIFEFNKAIIDATHGSVCGFKPNAGFYGRYGLDGYRALSRTIAYIHENYPALCVILDAKRGDIGATAEMYAGEVFDFYKADASTVNPYLGSDTWEPFTNCLDKGTILLCKTSNKKSGDIQNLYARKDSLQGDLLPIYIHAAMLATEQWKQTKNVGIVVGATFPKELEDIRKVVGNEMPILIPGIGTQGGDLEATMKANGDGLAIINSSSGIIYAFSKVEDGDEMKFAEYAALEAQKLRDQINQLR